MNAPIDAWSMDRQGSGRLLPQFRVTVNSRCGRACFFCRPSGEAVLTAAGTDLNVDRLVSIGRLVRRAGVTGVKLTGGDPALYDPLEEAAERLRTEAAFGEVEVISRHPRIGPRADELARAGVTQFNMSVDTLDPELHKEITGQGDHAAVLDALRACVATGVPVKVNMVVMAGVNDDEVADLAAFCAREGVATLKLLDVIQDLDAGAESFAKRLARKRAGRVIRDLYVPLESITAQFAEDAVEISTRTQGGLGHPMTVLSFATGFEVVVKDSTAGAWYGSVCDTCPLFPCHDALMALRLTADLRLQFCLLREDITVPLGELFDSDGGELESTVQRALDVYAGATFRVEASKVSVAEVLS
ncbi:radical SAM protein [Micromonospora sp. CA-263727]|uniref:radical SAM protein n=1 Tax=Micromonospora sp. CA-263727 TaxID=3239967 RepID=UPI003D908F42